MKKKQKKNIALGIIGAVFIGLIISYYYNAEQTRLKGFSFGNELQSIQDDLKKFHLDFESKIGLWIDDELSTEEMLEYSSNHILQMNELLLRYEKLSPPEDFIASVELFRLSTDTQIKSDIQIIEWIKTGDSAMKLRSDSLFQESFEYEIAALSEFNNAKLGKNP